MLGDCARGRRERTNVAARVGAGRLVFAGAVSPNGCAGATLMAKDDSRVGEVVEQRWCDGRGRAANDLAVFGEGVSILTEQATEPLDL